MPLIPASKIKQQLDAVIIQAETKEPLLAKRLKEFKSWISPKKDGLLNSKRHALGFLKELIDDCNFWLIIQPLSKTDRAELFDGLDISPAKRYWYEILLPAWFHERDPHSPIWKQKIMSGEFQNSDDQTISQLNDAIMDQGGSAVWRYILDLSMATDLLVTGSTQQALCIQLTSITDPWLEDKSQKWSKTLRHWKIPRGLLLSYSKVNANYSGLAKITLNYSDILAPGRYTVEKT
jgi:hypothetical protein